MDIRLIPVLLILYLLAFLDREYHLPINQYGVQLIRVSGKGGNIGNAKIEGLAEDLRLTGNQYNICLTVFFLSYAVFELPSNLLLKKLRPSRWLPFIMVCWGTVMTLMGIVQNYSGLLAARFFLGIAEAGLYPGCAVRKITYLILEPGSDVFDSIISLFGIVGMRSSIARPSSTQEHRSQVPSVDCWLMLYQRWTEWEALRVGDGSLS